MPPTSSCACRRVRVCWLWPPDASAAASSNPWCYRTQGNCGALHALLTNSYESLSKRNDIVLSKMYHLSSPSPFL